MGILQRQSDLDYKPRNSRVKSLSKSFQLTLLIANSMSLLLAVLYFLTDSLNQLNNLFGILLIVTLFGNLLLTLFDGDNQVLDYFYLVFATLSMISVPVLTTYVSLDVTNTSSNSIVSISFIIFLFLIGLVNSIAKLNYHHSHHDRSIPLFSTNQNIIKDKLKTTVAYLLSFNLILGIYVAYSLLARNSVASILEVFIPEYAFFIGLYSLGLTLLIWKLRSNQKYSFYNFLIGIIGASIFIVCSLPMLIVPFFLQDIEERYVTAFGLNFKEVDQSKHFKNTPFSIPEYFFGTPSGTFSVKREILFYQGTEGVDQGIELSFDAYLPPEDEPDLPGNRSVLIRIHGGGWTIGDKGSANYPQINKYFASQGYVVFDVQYGLANKEKFINYSSVPETRIGDFSIDDMVRHIGIFTNYLEEHQQEYGANLKSVFVSGGSAGGHLANAVGLAVASGEYNYLLNSTITVKGIIPFYPANGLATNLGINGTDQLVDPTLLIEKDSPPTLIYQGTHDTTVEPAIATEFHTKYQTQDNNQAALLMMPFASHGSNFYFSSYYNQMFIYYMERFMYQFQ
ncbi:alpha/beta hydrolase [Aquibacillus saliphilus]|uniref:alpha/beta hydrolase n=1 Tax=Aquibacillus saliphilus TaxID=1909422 RepID=UPI001CF0339F|nr:alpha/beta hydrolase [Aquibacillus saliphilus]